MHSVRDGQFWDTAPAPEADRRNLRSRRCRRRHFRPCRGVPLSPAGRRRGENPDPRKQRRFRRPCPPQRVHRLQRQARHRLWRFAVAADAELFFAAGQEGAGRRRHRPRRVRQAGTTRAWHETRGLGEAVFFPKEAFGTDALVTTSRNRRRLGAEHAAQRQGQARPDRTHRRAARLSPGQVARGEIRDPVEDHLRRFPDEDLRLRPAASSPISSIRPKSISASASTARRRSTPGAITIRASPAWISATCPTRP